MKIRKEAVILGVVIVVLSLYLIFNKSDRSLYDLPNIKPVPVSEISKISMDSSEGSILLIQKAGEWVVNQEAYPGDKNTIKQVAEIISNLSMTTLISESENYERYDLDPDHKIIVKAWAGDTLVREFDVGKAASGHRHTYVKLAGNHRVYHAGESFRNRMQGKADKFRDKAVMSFEPDQIQQIQLSKKDEQSVFIKEKTPEVSNKTPTDGEPLEMEEAKPVWKNAAGDVVKDNKLTKLIGDLSSLKCSAFIEDREKTDFKDPIVTVTLKGSEEFSLSIFERSEKGASRYPAISSQNDYAFFLPKWQADQVVKALDDIVPVE
jgi:hypothetical protein